MIFGSSYMAEEYLKIFKMFDLDVMVVFGDYERMGQTERITEDTKELNRLDKSRRLFYTIH